MRTFALFIVMISATGCSGIDSVGSLPRGNGNAPDEPGAEEPGADDPKTGDPASCTTGRKLVGFGGRDLAAGRLVFNAGVDRARVKPYETLAGEYTRVMGKVPASLAGAEATFGSPPDRWFDEPNVSGTVTFTAFRVAFDACLDAPEQTCAAFQRKAWSRTPSPQEIAACDAVAKSEGWPTACAAVLTSGGFITY